MIEDFKELVKCQISLYSEQEKYMKEHRDYIINNLEGIKNQKDEDDNYIRKKENHLTFYFILKI